MINQKEINKLEDEKIRIDLQNDNASKLAIKIELTIDGEVIASRTAFDFEGAEENLGKLQRWYEKEQDKQLAEAKRIQEEVEELEGKAN